MKSVIWSESLEVPDVITYPTLFNETLKSILLTPNTRKELMLFTAALIDHEINTDSETRISGFVTLYIDEVIELSPFS